MIAVITLPALVKLASLNPILIEWLYQFDGIFISKEKKKEVIRKEQVKQCPSGSQTQLQKELPADNSENYGII